MKKLDQKLRVFAILGSKVVLKLKGVSQFLSSTLSLVNDRFTHSIQVAQLGLIAAANIKRVTGFNLNKTGGLEVVCMAHDFGHPPTAHTGADTIDEEFKNYGLAEGFDDNSQVFCVLERHGLVDKLIDAEIAGLVKYRHKLYPCQEESYGHIIDRAISKDTERLKKAGFKPKAGRRHSLTNLMDIVDEIAYTTADCADAICIGLVDGAIISELDGKFSDISIVKTLAGIKEAVRIDSKTQIRDMFAALAVDLAKNLTLNQYGEVVYATKEFKQLRMQLFSLIVKPCFTKDLVLEARDADDLMLRKYIKAVVEDGYMPSKTYAAMVENAETEEDRLRALRDMIAETPEQTIREYVSQL